MEIDLQNDSYLFKTDCTVTGKEILMAQNSCDENGLCDHRLEYYCRHENPDIITLLAGEILLAATYIGCKNEYLGNGLFRIYLPEGFAKKLFVGQIICIRHSSYGPVAILVKNSANTVLRDVKMRSIGGMGVVILPRSHNFTAERLVIKNEKKELLMSGNCDGIHITGLSGKLVLKDCEFVALGDDALNIHSTAATVTESDLQNGTIRCNYCKKSPDGLLSPEWCQEGDIISVLDSKTCARIGTFEVEKFHVDRIRFKNLTGELPKGAVLQNMEFNAAVEMQRCKINKMRARGCVFQTENITISGCVFSDIPLAAIHSAPDLKKWYEVGAVKNMTIEKNIFDNCCAAYNAEYLPVIGFSDNHDSLIGCGGIVHRNITIKNNTFNAIRGRCLYLSAIEGAKVECNIYNDCVNGEYMTIESINCKNISIVD